MCIYALLVRVSGRSTVPAPQAHRHILGSDAIEAAMKCARQYWWELGEDRTCFIARKQSYHGATLGALALSGHQERRKLYECLLTSRVSHVSACNPYHDRKEGQSDEQYVHEKAKELDDEFQRLGPKKVIAFVAEPVVGAVSVFSHFAA